MVLSTSEVTAIALEKAREQFPEVDPASWQLVSLSERSDPLPAAEEIILHGRVITGPRSYWQVVLVGANSAQVTLDLGFEDGHVQSAVKR